ncbi:MAG: ankyrin repeat domain-containing protein [Nitrospira sp.]
MDLSQVPIAKIFWTVLAVEVVAFAVLLIVAFRAGSSGPEGMVGAWIVLIPPIVWAVLAWLFQRTDSPTLQLAYTAFLVLPLVQVAVGPIFTQVQHAVWERGWRGSDYFTDPAHLKLAGAIYDRDVESVKALIPGAGDLNKPYRQDTTLFDYAMSNTDASDASFEILRALVAAGANPNVPPGRPLTLALSQGPRFAQLLLDAGADPNAIDGGRPVWWTVLSAAQDQDLTLLQLLLDRGADIKHRDGEGGPVAWAAYQKAWRAMWLLMERGADWKGEQAFGVSVHQMLLNERQYRRDDVPAEFRQALATYEAADSSQP